MAKQAPNPIDILDFQFKLHCRLKIFTNEDNSIFDKTCNLIAAASRYGLVFVGTASATFQVIQASEIEKHSLKEGGISNYNHRTVSLPSPPRHVSVNCDSTKLAVVVEKHGCATGIIYDITSFTKQDVSIIAEIRLSSTPGVTVVETSWNPTISDIFTACKSDGTLGLYEFKHSGVDVNELPADSQATCMCWSPKGKQIAVGSRDGRITQYKPDLKAVKVVNPPPLEEPKSVITLRWISNYQFIAMFRSQNPEGVASLLVIDAPKTGQPVYTNYEDICYSYGNIRPVQFYMIFQSSWNVLMVASSNSMEVGIMGYEGEQWVQWILGDSARAELPLSSLKQETMPVGLEFDTSSTAPVLWGETSLPPAPFLLLMSHHGLLCCFKAINIKSSVATTICQAPEALKDTSGLCHFTSESPEAVKIEKTLENKVEPIKDISTVTIPTPIKPVITIPQVIFSFSSATTAPTMANLFTNTLGTKTSGGLSTTIAQPKAISSIPSIQQQTATTFDSSKSIFDNVFTNSAAAAAPPLATTTIAAVTKPLAIRTTAVAPTIPQSVAVVNTPNIPSPHLSETKNIVQEEADILISKLIREECETLEAELKALLHKDQNVKINLGSDKEAVDLVCETDNLQDFLNEATETSSSQAAEVHVLKQGLIQAWAWYEDARSRFAQSQDTTFETLLRIQQLDPVSQRYSASIKHITYYLESQLMQAEKVLDEQWENFQDSCKKIIKMKIPTMETIYQTMVRQSAIHQKQMYILKDIANRIRAHRSKVNGPSLLISLNNVDQLEEELRKLQLVPEHLLQAQYERVYRNHKHLTPNKINKLNDLLLNRKITRVSVSKPQISTVNLSQLSSMSNTQALIRNVSESATLLDAGLSPIASSKVVAPRVVDFTQSTPKFTMEQNNAPLPLESDMLKKLPPGITVKFTPNTTVPSLFGQATVTNPVTGTAQLAKFADVPSTSSTAVSVAPSSSSTATAVNQLNFSFTPTTKTSTTSAQVPLFSAAQPKSAPEQNKGTFTITPVAAAKPNTTTETTQFNLSSVLPDSTTTVKPTTSFAIFNLSKPNSSSAFSFNAAAATTTASTKSLANTTSSAFVPTTQLSFNFSTKTNIATTMPTGSVAAAATSTTTASGAFALTKSSTFNFGNSAAAFTFSSGTAPAPTTQPSMATESPALFAALKSPLAANTTVAVSTTPIQSLFKAVSVAEATTTSATAFQTLVTPKPILTTPTTAAKIATSTVAPTTITSSQFSFINKAALSPIITTADTVTTKSGDSSVFAEMTGSILKSPPTTSDATVSSTSTESLFGTPVSTATTEFMFGTASMSNIFGGTTTTATTSPIFALAATTAPIFGTVATTITSTSATTAPGLVFSAATVPSMEAIVPSTVASTTAVSIFGSPVVSTTTTTATTVFGGVVPATTVVPLFGSTTVTSSTPIFGSASSSSSIFSTTSTTDVSTTSTSIFGATPATSSSPFGGVPISSATASVFGQPASTMSSSIFGAPPAVFGSPTTTAASTPFGGSSATASNAFGNSTTSGSLFGQQSQAFGSGSVFGATVSSSGNTFGSATPSNFSFGSSESIFGTPSTTQSAFGQTPSSFSFAAAAASIPTTNTPFGFSKPAPFGFGSTSESNVNTDGSSFSFGNLNVGATTKADTSFGSGFGQQQSQNGNPFAKALTQEQKPAFGSGSLFGTPVTTTSASIFGSGSTSTFGSPPGFGSSPTFGQQQPPTFGGQNTFGNSSFGSPSQPGPFSTGNQSVAQSGFGGFNQAQKQQLAFGGAPAFGGSPSGFGAPPSFGGSPAFGASPTFGGSPKVFGESNPPAATFGSPTQPQNSTFANLANQNTLGFGSLAAAGNQQQMSGFQSGGSSSFSAWR